MGGWCVITIGPEGFCQAVECPDGWSQAARLAELREQTMPAPAWTHDVRRAFTLGRFDPRGAASDEIFHTPTMEPA